MQINIFIIRHLQRAFGGITILRVTVNCSLDQLANNISSAVNSLAGIGRFTNTKLWSASISFDLNHKR